MSVKKWVKKHPGKTAAAVLGSAAVLSGGAYVAHQNKDSIGNKLREGWTKFKGFFA
jgi:hypothetical protein